MSDPFEELDRGYGAGSVRDPYPIFAEWRRKGDVQPSTPHEMMGLQLGPRPDNAPPGFTVLSHAAVSEVLRDGERFTSRAYATTMGIVMGHTILEMDEPEHTRYRSLVQKGFTKKALARWESELIGPVIRECIDSFAADGRADLRRSLMFPFPVNIIARMLGLPDTELDRFHRHAAELISIGFDWERGLRASKALGETFAALIAERRRDPRDDIVSVLTHAEIEGNTLSDDDIIAFLRLLLPAGAETTYRSASNLLFGLLTHPEQLEAVRKDRSLIPQATEEALRWESPLTGIIRMASRDTKLAGVAIPKGAFLSVCVAAANHDETRYDAPEKFDIFRPARQHMSFGFGAHRCLGMDLARLETQVALEALLDRFPDLRLDPDVEDVHITGLIFRSPTSLPVLFTPA